VVRPGRSVSYIVCTSSFETAANSPALDCSLAGGFGQVGVERQIALPEPGFRASPRGQASQVALEAAKGGKTLSELSSEYSVHHTQISEWKSRLLRDGASVFSTTTARQQRDQEALQAELYEQIGRLRMELEGLAGLTHG